MLLSALENPNDTPATPPPVLGSSGDRDNPESENEMKELLANSYTWYASLELLLRPQLRQHKIPYIP